MKIPQVKICCITSIEEARVALDHGAHALGFVSEMPSGPGVIPETEIATIRTALPTSVDSFLLTSKTDVEKIIEQQRRCGVTTLQLCDRTKPEAHKLLRETVPDVRLVQVIHILGEDSVREAEQMARTVDALLLDSGRPNARQRELGGTGRTHDWEISRRIRELVAVPIYLAGGLHAGNVVRAIRQVEPFAVDLCSGVRTDGKLDKAKLGEFLKQVRSVGVDHV